MDNKQKLLAALQERCQSLIHDGYSIIYTTDNKGWHYVKLRHSNGNYVSVIAYSNDCSIVQRTNGHVVHYEKVCKS